MAVGVEISGFNLESLREQLGGMSDAELIQFGNFQRSVTGQSLAINVLRPS